NQRHPFFKFALIEAVEAAFDLDDLDRASELLEEWERMRPTDRTPFLEAHHARFQARLARRRAPADGVEGDLLRAAAAFRDLEVPFYLGITLAERGDWLAEQGRTEEAEAALAEAREIFERLEAKAWLDRLDSWERARTWVPA